LGRDHTHKSEKVMIESNRRRRRNRAAEITTTTKIENIASVGTKGPL